MKKRGLSRLEKSLFLMPLLLLVVPLGLRLLQRDSLERRMAAMSEPDVVDCGLASISTRDEEEAAMACAVAAAKEKRPFRLRFYYGRKVTSDAGYIGTSDGQLIHFQYTRRYRHGVPDWEMIEVFQGPLKIIRLRGRERVSYDNAKKIESTQRYWPLVTGSA